MKMVEFLLHFQMRILIKITFFSIERVDNDVLYTIYRTNWFRGTRNSYDTATLIINEKKGTSKSIDCLTKIIITSMYLKKLKV